MLIDEKVIETSNLMTKLLLKLTKVIGANTLYLNHKGISIEDIILRSHIEQRSIEIEMTKNVTSP